MKLIVFTQINSGRVSGNSFNGSGIRADGFGYFWPEFEEADVEWD